MINSIPPIDPNETSSSEQKREPMFNAPVSMVILSALLVVLYFLYSIQSYEVKQILLIDYALFPERFFAGANSQFAYDNALSKALPFIGHGLLHADWMHVGMNAAFALAFGSGVVKVFGWWRTLLIYAGSQIGGAALYLIISQMGDGQTSIAVGASGAVSGLTGAVFLLMAKGRLVSEQFVKLSGFFLVGNIALAFLGPALFGSAIAWEAHVGGYMVGAMLSAGMLRYLAES